MTPQELRARIETFAGDVARFAKPLRSDAAAKDPADQLARAAAATAANYRAATLARSHAEFVSKIGVALEESDESVFWLQHLQRAKLASGNGLDDLLQEAAEITAILGASRRTSARRGQTARSGRRTANSR